MYLGILSKPQFEGDKNVDVTVVELSEYMKKKQRVGQKREEGTNIDWNSDALFTQ